MFRSKYETLLNLADDFYLIYLEILNYYNSIDKTIVFDWGTKIYVIIKLVNIYVLVKK